jgi:hypothetical protein
MKMKTKLSCISVLLAVCAFTQTPGLQAAELKLADPFGDEMVLQQGMALPLWGLADPGEGVGS